MPTAKEPSTVKRQRTQWTAQFLAASELVRNGYVVSFTMGNHTPTADLMVGTPNTKSLFWVDVKGLSSNSGWLIKKKPTLANLFYVLVRVGENRANDAFFILSHHEINSLIDKSLRLRPNDPTEGFAWKDAAAFKDQWKVLPGWVNTPLK